MSNPGHRPGVKAKSEEERIARRNASNAKAQQRAYERRKKRDVRRAVLDAQLNGPSTPQIVREAQAAPLTAERSLPALERELAERTREKKKAAAELAAAHLRARITQEADEAEQLNEEKEKVLSGDDHGLSSALATTSFGSSPPAGDAPLAASELMSDVVLTATGQPVRHAAFQMQRPLAWSKDGV